eukprot:GHVO01045130.1.p1 GENE.GHVO01045130.1~~GHVO01045130.1.p1  ORF type:complete len:374 (-),score=24.59 GHVO01045130.1:1060-2181(-)
MSFVCLLGQVHTNFICEIRFSIILYKNMNPSFEDDIHVIQDDVPNYWTNYGTVNKSSSCSPPAYPASAPISAGDRSHAASPRHPSPSVPPPSDRRPSDGKRTINPLCVPNGQNCLCPKQTTEQPVYPKTLPANDIQMVIEALQNLTSKLTTQLPRKDSFSSSSSESTPRPPRYTHMDSLQRMQSMVSQESVYDSPAPARQVHLDYDLLGRLQRQVQVKTLERVRNESEVDSWFIGIERKMKIISTNLEYQKYIVAANLDGEAIDTWLEVDTPSASYIETRNRFFLTCFPDSLQGDELRDQLKAGKEFDSAEDALTEVNDIYQRLQRINDRTTHQVIPPDRDFKRALYKRIPYSLRLLLREKASDSITKSSVER